MSGGYTDDPRIRGCAELWRRIHPKQFVMDGNTGRMRPSSAAFIDSSDGTPMSVLQAKIVAATGRDEYSVLRQYPGEAMVAFTARLARRLGQAVTLAQLPQEPAHSYVFGEKPKKAGENYLREELYLGGGTRPEQARYHTRRYTAE
jgi:hypothetical protein